MNMFKRSANELKSIQCLAVTGVLVAIYVVMNAYIAVNTEVLKITFGFLALATIGMLYGPVVAMIAAIPCDIITALLAGMGINFAFTPVKIIEGFIYGIFLYGFAKNHKINFILQGLRILIPRLLVVLVCHVILNSLLIYFIILSADARENLNFGAFLTPRLSKNAVQFPIDVLLMWIVLPVAGLAYKKSFKKQEREHD